MEEQPLYYICFIDLMGQKDFFKGINSCEVDAATMDHVKRVTNGLCVMVRYVKNRYKRNFVESDDVGVELFSDSIMLSKKVGEKPYDKLAVWFDVIVKLVYIACKYKLPFRGGIAKGNAERSKSSSIYGVGVDAAMELEQKIADFPRIVFANRLAKELVETGLINKYFEMDSDSAYVLNYAGYQVLSFGEFDREREQLPEIVKWVQECYKGFCFAEDEKHNKFANPKLARRYKMWLDYLALAFTKSQMKYDG